ncbi:hypothetical protein LSUCC0031_08900 [Rhodobacterales bacterium LSUCC0031]|nr:hypothetical protein [Rhodobacterales bacterium LSUCC0031]
MRCGGNLGATRLRAKARQGDPMRVYDSLPPELRAWISHAALPWSPLSCLRLWQRALREEGCPMRARARLDRAEAACLARDRRLGGGHM